MQGLGEVKVADDEDFSRLKLLCQVHDGWKQVYCKNGVFVWTKTNDVSDFNLVKVVFAY
jgi:StAR-related lipid transfer protein 10